MSPGPDLGGPATAVLPSPGLHLRGRPRPATEDPPMSQTGLPHDLVEYPCSDGQLMAETDIHAMCMV